MSDHAWHVFHPHPKGGQQAGPRPVALYCQTCGFITQLCPRNMSLMKWRAAQPPCPVTVDPSPPCKFRAGARNLLDHWRATAGFATCDVCGERHQFVMGVSDPFGRRTSCLPCFVFTPCLELKP